MSGDPSVTYWINQLQQGDRDVIHGLWQVYYPKLVRLAAGKLRGLPPGLLDAEELANSAFKSFCLAAERQRFPRLTDRDDLWQVLVHMIRNKAASAWEFHTRDKRDFNRVEYDALKAHQGDSDDVSFVKNMLQSREPDPAFAAEVAEQCEHLLAILPDDELRKIAIFKMEGYTNKEIGDRIGCAPVTVERRLSLIRRAWLCEAGPGARKSEGPDQ